jgi:ureidoglycolate hydrolase
VTTPLQAIPLLSADAVDVAEFGELLDPGGARGLPYDDAVGAWADRASALWRSSLEIVRLPNVSGELTLETMEIHPDSGQISAAFDRALVIVLFRGTPPASYRDATAVTVPKEWGFLIRKGIWHCGLRALGGESRAVAIFREGTGANSEVRPTPGPIVVVPDQ